MLNSLLLIIYDMNKIYQEIDTNYPLTYHFINSTHNTYLTGHQLTRDSSFKMYSLSVFQGCLLVELDCYNGKGEDIIITYGYTLAIKLLLDDVLYELKENLLLNHLCLLYYL